MPGAINRVGGCPALPLPERLADKRVVAIVPGGLDEHAPQMAVAGFGDRAARLFGAARVFGWDQAGKRHHARRRRKAARVAQFGGDGQRGEVVDAAEAAQAFHTPAQRLQREELTQVRVDGLEARKRIVDGTDIGAMRLRQCRQRPRLGVQPRMVARVPRALGLGKPATVAEQEFREPMPRAEQIGLNVFTTAQEIARGLVLLGRDMDRGERAGALEDGELARVAAVRLDAIARPARN